MKIPDWNWTKQKEKGNSNSNWNFGFSNAHALEKQALLCEQWGVVGRCRVIGKVEEVPLEIPAESRKNDLKMEELI